MFTPGCREPDATALDAVCTTLADLATATDADGPWRSGAFAILARSGALAGFIPEDCGGTAAPEPARLTLLAAIAARCLTTALVLTQWAAACRIIAGGTAGVRSARLPALARGDTPTTVGISQLTTSRRHLAAPALTATPVADGWRVSGQCPWVTGADSSDTIVTGAVGPGGDPLFFVVPTAAPGIDIAAPMKLLALSGSRTSSVTLRDVAPADVILPAAAAARTGGLATTALAVGATRAAVALLDDEARGRPALQPVAHGLRSEATRLWGDVLETAAAGPAAAAEGLRTRANGLVVRAAQAALTASKGAGFVAGHPAERLVREASFFLVWSCPHAVSAAVLCELAGLDGP